MPTVFVPKEIRESETRAAANPDTVARLIKYGMTVQIQAGAGAGSHIADQAYEAAGATIVADAATGYGSADLVFKLNPPTPGEISSMREGTTLVSFVNALTDKAMVEALNARKISSIAMELVPRITRAQKMDALSSQANLAGYKSVIMAAEHLPKIFPMLMTAAGTIQPARVVIMGAGVAGLQAIATAKRLGCKVEATDIRLAAKEQVESLGAKFIDVPGAEDMEDSGGYAKEATPEFLAKQREEVAKRVADADLVITTALVPGRPAPKLVSEEMVRSMRMGAVIVDLAVESGGNCALSKEGEIVNHEGVKIVGTPNLPSTVPEHASELYSKNVFNLVKLFIGEEGALQTDFEDEVLAGCLLTHKGEVRHAQTAETLSKQDAS
jgi:NAD(P) transhydrogenase subunit alpha